jgi:hypothetical protein
MMQCMTPSEIAGVVVIALIASWSVFFGLLLLASSRKESGSERLGVIVIAVGRILFGVGVGLILLSEHGVAIRRVTFPVLLGSVFLMISGQVIMRRKQKRRESSDQTSAP